MRRPIVIPAIVILILWFPSPQGCASSPVVVDFTDVEVGRVLEAFGKAMGRTVVVEREVDLEAKITLKLKGLMVNEALTRILEGVGLVWERIDDYIVVRKAYTSSEVVRLKQSLGHFDEAEYQR